MSTPIFVTVAFIIACNLVFAGGVAGPESATEPRFDFATQILPILTKAGCNSGACHGAAIGQGGFRLSLLGYDPQADYENITRELSGRRIDLASPELSLFLRKPTRQIDHEGGLRIKRGSDAYAKLMSWIAAGSPYGNKNLQVERIQVTPADLLLARTNDSVQLRVMAFLSDGTSEDVTSLALYNSNDDSVADVDKEGSVTMLRRGVTTVMVRYSGQVAATRLGVPFQDAPLPDSDFPVQNFIDQIVLGELKRLRLPPSTLSSDSEFLRRVHLDVLGELPSENDVRAFLSSPRNAESRRKVIDQLLRQPALADFWTLKLADLLLIHSKRLGETAARAYYQWLHQQVAANLPLKQIISDLLTAAGDVEQVGPANFQRLKQDPRDMADFVSQALLGIRIACARCHNHPTDRWTQDDYHRFAAYFARVSFEGKRLSVSNRGEVRHPKSNKPVAPKPLGSGASNEAIPPDRRAALASWLVQPGNPMLGRALVNRVWKELMGRGLVEPVDDLRLTNPPSHPVLLDALAAEFVSNGYDLQWLIRTIASSRTYQLSSQMNDINRADDRFFSHAYLKPMGAQVLADAISRATGMADSYAGYPEGTRAVAVMDPQTPAYHLDVFGRCQRDAICETPSRTGGGLAQALHVINGITINSKLGPAIRSLSATHDRSDAEIVTALYLRALSRFPGARELAHWNSLVASAPNRDEVLEDLLWALLNCQEFAFIH